MGLAGRIVKLLAFIRVPSNHSGAPQSDVKVDQGGSDIVTAEHFAPPGDDSFPCDQDYAATVPLSRAGRSVVAGYADVVNQPRAEKGDKRIYGRKASDGTWVCEVWLKNDGTIFINNGVASTTMLPNGTTVTVNPAAIWTHASTGEISGVNGSGYYRLEPGGDFVSNGAKFLTDGDVVTSDGKSLRNHTHSQPSDGGGDSEAETSKPS